MIQKIILILTSVLFLASCGTFQPRRIGVDDDLLPYILTFEEHCSCSVDIDVTISQDVNPAYAGVAIFHDDGRREIRINKAWYNIWKYSYYAIEQVVWHEAGHAILNRGHDSRQDSIFINGIYYDRPYSIMNWRAFGQSPVYTILHDYYIQELFN